MLKKGLIFIFSIILLSACNQASNDETVGLGEDFIKEVYTVDEDDVFDFNDSQAYVDYQEKFDKYLTASEFQELSAKREFILPVEVANKLETTLDVKDISMEEDESAAKDKKRYFDHQFTVVIADNDEMELNGQMTIEEIDGDLKISRYFVNNKLPNLLTPVK